MHGDILMTVLAMKVGAVEFLTKPFRDQDMLDAVQLGLERDRRRRENEKAASKLKARFESLTLREQEIMGLVTAGLMNKQIAGEVGVNEITVKVHRGSVMRKMAANSLAELVRMADALGVRRTVPRPPIHRIILLMLSTFPTPDFNLCSVARCAWSHYLSPHQ